jgi:hypothetical protein
VRIELAGTEALCAQYEDVEGGAAGCGGDGMSLDDAKKHSANAKASYSVDGAINQTIRAIDAIIEYLESRDTLALGVNLAKDARQ